MQLAQLQALRLKRVSQQSRPCYDFSRGAQVSWAVVLEVDSANCSDHPLDVPSQRKLILPLRPTRTVSIQFHLRSSVSSCWRHPNSVWSAVGCDYGLTRLRCRKRATTFTATFQVTKRIARRLRPRICKTKLLGVSAVRRHACAIVYLR